MKRIVAYYRVSTQQQGRSGLGLEAQQAAVRACASASGWAVVAEYTEVESGRRPDRPQLAAALAHAREACATLVVAKLDRLARNAQFLLSLADGAVPLHFLDLPDLNCESAAGRMILTIMASVAEFESRRIGERVRAAHLARVARAKAKGEELRPLAERQRRANAAWHAQNRRRAEEFRARHRPAAAALRLAMTLAAVAGELNRLGIKTRRGKEWSPGLVWWLLKERT